MSARHSANLRGLTAAATSPNFQGRFRRMFPHLPAAKFGKTDAEEQENLQLLAKAMVSDFDPPKDGLDEEESGIPALYTYLGQFVDHDLTFDPDGSFQKQKDRDAKVDFRSPAFDLDNVYGRGPGDQPYLYESDSKSFVLGDPITLGSPNARDLPRSAAGRALIGDPRNDENAIVSQLQGLFLKFHNRVVREHSALAFAAVQQFVRHHYQYVVLNDFLPRIVSSAVLDGLKTNGVYDRAKLKYFTAFESPYMPIEFSVAAYRLGHSMVRPGYRLNDSVLVPIFPLPPSVAPGFPEGLTGFRRLISDWALDWGRFIDLEARSDGSEDPGSAEANFRRLQFAYRLDTSLVDPLGSLPPAVASNPSSLALRNLQRGAEFGLPSGQEVAKAVGASPLSDQDILIGKAVDSPEKPLPSITTISRAFSGNCPLWTYVLAEAMQHKVAVTIPVEEKKTVNTPQLGPVGGRIVAETFLGLLFSDPGAYLATKPSWKPAASGNYRLKDFVAYALN